MQWELESSHLCAHLVHRSLESFRQRSLRCLKHLRRRLKKLNHCAVIDQGLLQLQLVGGLPLLEYEDLVTDPRQ